MLEFEKVCSEQDIMTYNHQVGCFFFGNGEMSFFNSRLETGAVFFENALYFVTSEKFNSSTPRGYTVRKMTKNGHIESVTKFNTIRGLQNAIKELNKIVLA